MSDYPRPESIDVYPLPEALGRERGAGWAIFRSPMAGVDLPSRRMFVPLGPGPDDYCARVHELGHVAWTRGDPGKLSARLGVDELVYQAVEDNRIEGWLSRIAGVNLFPLGLALDRVRDAAGRIVALRDHRSACLLLIATTHAAAGPVVRATLERAARKSLGFRVALEVADGATVRLWRHPRPTQDQTGRVARWVQRRLEAVHDHEPHGETSASTGDAWSSPMPDCPRPPLRQHLIRRAKAIRGALREALGLVPVPSEDEPTDDFPSAGSLTALPDRSAIHDGLELLRLALTMDAGAGHNFVPWGPMDVQEPERVIAHAGRLGRWKRPTEEGVYLRYPHRYLSDRRVFAHRRRVPGGGVLIDASGSMHLSAGDVDRVVAAAPGAHVLGYAASTHRGVLRVLVRDGRRVAPEDCDFSAVGTSNVIDLPALEYLARLRVQPKLWVSDGLVTGIGDRTGSENLRQVHSLTESKGIRRLASLDEAVALLNRLSRREVSVNTC